MKKKSKKTISMPYSEYMDDIKTAEDAGRSAGIKVIMDVVNDIYATGGVNITLGEKVSENIIEFIEMVKVKANLIPKDNEVKEDENDSSV